MALHPFVMQMMASARAAGRPGLSDGTPADARALVAASRPLLGAGPAMEEVCDCLVPGRDGPIPARLYVADRAKVQGLLVYLHGGGWVCGSLDDFDLLTRALAARTDCAVLAVDYRLAPEHPFPAGLHDVEDALLWASRAGQERFGRTLPLVVAGDSAGGNLATVALAELRHQVECALQVLVYPVADTDTSRPSYLQHGEGLPLTRQDMRWFLQHYADPGQWSDPRIAPLSRIDMAGCPPAWIVVAEYDVLHDEGVALAHHLAQARVPVDLVRAPGLAHGFIRLFNLLPEVDALLDQAAARIRQACHPAPGLQAARPR